MDENNIVFIKGYVTQELQERYIATGDIVAVMFLNIARPNAEGYENLIKVVVWTDLAEVCINSLKVGSFVAVEGRLQTSQWTDEDGEPQSKTEVIASDVLISLKPSPDAPKRVRS